MTPKRTLSALAIAAIAAQGVFASTAVAMPGKDHKFEMSVIDFDANADGSVSVEEFDTGVSAKMSEWHAKKADWHSKKSGSHANSGNADAEDDAERPGKRGKMTPPKGADLDTDGDGNVSEEEFNSHMQEMRDRWKNRDANASEGQAGNATDDVADTATGATPGTELGNDGNADDDTATK